MANQLPPPPINSPPGSREWKDWQTKVRQSVAVEGVTWANVNKSGSNITDIVNRSHNNLQSMQGGSTNEYYHLTAAQHASLTSLLNQNYAAAMNTNNQSITSSTTLTNITSLSHAVGTSQVWFCEYTVRVYNIGTTGYKVGFSVPTGTTVSNVAVGVMPNVISTSGVYNKISGSTLNCDASEYPGATSAILKISARITTSSTAGTVQLQMAQYNLSATALEIGAGSAVTAYRIS